MGEKRMDHIPQEESATLSSPIPSSSSQQQQQHWANVCKNAILTYQSFGVVYGDLCVSPLYVFKSTFVDKLRDHQNEDAVLGVFSLIFWTLTIIPLFKYILFVLSADDNGEGGTFALYSLLCRHGKFSLLPNQQAADEQLSTYKYGSPLRRGSSSVPLKRLFEKHHFLRTFLLVIVLLGTSMLISDGVITPAMSVLSSVSGIQVPAAKLSDGIVVVISCIILVGLFALQHFGTHRVAFIFAPIVITWLLSIFTLGIYNIFKWNPQIVYALSPLYIIKFFRQTGKDGWISLGGILLSITGAEAMFADLGHFTAFSIRLAFVLVVYPCLVIQYMGQAAFLSKNVSSIPRSFYDSVPDSVYWPVFVIATLASIVGSQAIITATFSVIKQCHALGCFPRVKIVHTSKHIFGQIYIPEINWILMIITLAITIGFQDTTDIGNAYGIAAMSVMFITTFLMTLVLIIIWQKNILLAVAFLLFFGFIEGAYLSSAFMKVSQGGWISILLAAVFMTIKFVWQYGTRKKYNFDHHNKVPLKWLIGLGPSLGIVRVPGIGLIYSELAIGVPPIFSHFVTNLPAFHSVMVFVCVKHVPVPFVSEDERFLIGRVCPRPYRMYRCIVRYGYKDIQSRNEDEFENQLIQSIAEFIQMEAGESSHSSTDTASYDGKMAVISGRRRSTADSKSSCLVAIISSDQGQEEGGGSRNSSFQFSTKSSTLHSLRSSYEDNEIVSQLGVSRRCRVRFELPSQTPGMDPLVHEELLDLVQAKDAGVAYIIGHGYVKARRSSPLLKKFVVDTLYSFLRKNCRGSSVTLNIPHISLIEVGMTYFV